MSKGPNQKNRTPWSVKLEVFELGGAPIRLGTANPDVGLVAGAQENDEGTHPVLGEVTDRKSRHRQRAVFLLPCKLRWNADKGPCPVK